MSSAAANKRAGSRSASKKKTTPSKDAAPKAKRGEGSRVSLIFRSL